MASDCKFPNKTKLNPRCSSKCLAHSASDLQVCLNARNVSFVKPGNLEFSHLLRNSAKSCRYCSFQSSHDLTGSIETSLLCTPLNRVLTFITFQQFHDHCQEISCAGPSA